MNNARQKKQASPKRPAREPCRPAPHPTTGSAWLLTGGISVAVILVLIVHWPGLSAQALCFDDSEYLTNNPLVQQPGWVSARRFLSEVLEPSTVHGYYQPLTMITLMLDYAMGGRPDDLQSFHRTSLILHAINTALVIMLLYPLFGHALAAAGVGLLFGLHPMTVETIVWVGERKTVLAAFFALWSLIAYVGYARSGRKLLYGLCTATFILALMSKPTATPLVVCMLLLDIWPLNRLNKKAVIEKVPLFVVALISAYITYESQKRTAVTVLPGAAENKPILLIVCHNIIFYLYKIVWPMNLSSHYSFPYPMNLSNGSVLAGVMGTAVLIPILILSLRWTRALLVGWFFFFVALFPTLGVIGFTNVIAADKFAYLPSIGLMLPLVYFVARWQDAARPATAWKRCIGIVVVVAIPAVMLAYVTRSYLSKWRDTETLFRSMVSLTPYAAAPNIHLGLELDRQNRLDEAMACYRTAIKSAPSYHGTYYNLGNTLMKQNRLKEAIEQFKLALKLEPDFADAHNNLGNALFRAGDTAGAEYCYRQAIRLKWHYSDAHYNLANILRDQQKIDESIRHYEEALRIKPDEVSAHVNLGNVLIGQNRIPEAIEHYKEALRVQPDFASAHRNLGFALSRQGDPGGAIRHYREALRFRPEWWMVADWLAWIHATSKDFRFRDPDEAIRLAEDANRLTGGKMPKLLGTLAVAYAEAGRREIAVQTAQEAIQLATRSGQAELADEIRTRMAKYFPGWSFQEAPNNDNP